MGLLSHAFTAAVTLWTANYVSNRVASVRRAITSNPLAAAASLSSTLLGTPAPAPAPPTPSPSTSASWWSWWRSTPNSDSTSGTSDRQEAVEPEHNQGSWLLDALVDRDTLAPLPYRSEITRRQRTHLGPMFEPSKDFGEDVDVPSTVEGVVEERSGGGGVPMNDGGSMFEDRELIAPREEVAAAMGSGQGGLVSDVVMSTLLLAGRLMDYITGTDIVPNGFQ